MTINNPKEAVANFRKAQKRLRERWYRGTSVPHGCCILTACWDEATVGASARILYDMGAGSLGELIHWNDLEAADVEEVCSLLELAILVILDEAL